MRTARKVHADFGALLAAVYLDNAAFKALEGAFNHKNAVVFVKAHQGRANLRAQPHKMPDNLQVLARQRRNLRVILKKVVKIRQLLQLAQGRRRNLSLRLNNQVRRKNRLLLLKKPAPAPNRKLPGQINKSMLTGQPGLQLFQILNKNPLPPRSHLNNVVIHCQQYSGFSLDCHNLSGGPRSSVIVGLDPTILIYKLVAFLASGFAFKNFSFSECVSSEIGTPFSFA